jgi:hypothetical protein
MSTRNRYAKEMKSGAGDEEQQEKNKADYEQMKAIDKFLAGKKIRDAVEYIKILVLFIEHKI